jgi:hypothetical protein
VKQFIVEMDETDPCAYTGCDWDHCTGDLNNRPSWCPLRPVKPSNEVPSHTLCNEVWLEVKK